MDIVLANHFLRHRGRAIGKKGLESLELVKFLPWQNRQATRPLQQALQMLGHQFVDGFFYFRGLGYRTEQHDARQPRA
ncbi:hypothetical protein D3C78_1857330 [compost metagenome]